MDTSENHYQGMDSTEKEITRKVSQWLEVRNTNLSTLQFRVYSVLRKCLLIDLERKRGGKKPLIMVSASV